LKELSNLSSFIANFLETNVSHRAALSELQCENILQIIFLPFNYQTSFTDPKIFRVMKIVSPKEWLILVFLTIWQKFKDNMAKPKDNMVKPKDNMAILSIKILVIKRLT
jgi:hypothetical protein